MLEQLITFLFCVFWFPMILANSSYLQKQQPFDLVNGEELYFLCGLLEAAVLS
jgi:hypothetical protein